MFPVTVHVTVCFYFPTAQHKWTWQREPVEVKGAEPPVLMSRQRETQRNYSWCARGACASLTSHLPVIIWAEGFQRIVTMVSCHFVVPQMQLSNKTDGLRRLCYAGPVCCLRLITSDKSVTVCCICFCLRCCFLGRKWHKYGCSALLLSVKQE